MTTITVDGLHAESEPKGGFFARVLERIAEAQMQRARAVARPYLLGLSDEELSHVGHTRDEISCWPQSGARWV